MMMKRMQQPTKFTAVNHPTYKNDLDMVKKMMPQVASFASIATLAPSSDTSSDTMSLPDNDTKFERAKTEDVKHRDALVKVYGNGPEYKIEKLMKLEEKRMMMMNSVDLIDPVKDMYIHYDYDGEDMCMDIYTNDVEKKKLLVRTSMHEEKLKSDEAEKLRINVNDMIGANDYMAHFDYDSEMSVDRAS